MVKTLGIWMNGIRVGCWQVRNGRHSLIYAREWLESPLARPLSLSLPMSYGGKPLLNNAVECYFDNLLPDDNRLRRGIQVRFQTESCEIFDLLEAVGRDCIGAVQLLPDDEDPGDSTLIRGQSLSEADVAARIRGIGGGFWEEGGFADEDYRFSLAGAQGKIALLKHDGHWFTPLGTTATTHILKLPLGRIGPRKTDFSHSVDNEWLCLKIARLFGLPAAEAEILSFEDQRVLSVERFDRVFSRDGMRLLRIPQEDFCQAYGLPPDKKYESDGGPRLVQMLQTLAASKSAEADQLVLLKAQFLFYLLAATDGHAKNFSIRHLPGGVFQLARLYDILSAHPALGTGSSQWRYQGLKLALSLEGSRKHYRLDRIELRHFLNTAERAGIDPVKARGALEEMLDKVPDVMERAGEELPAGIDLRTAETILEGLRAQADRLKTFPAGL